MLIVFDKITVPLQTIAASTTSWSDGFIARAGPVASLTICHISASMFILLPVPLVHVTGPAAWHVTSLTTVHSVCHPAGQRRAYCSSHYCPYCSSYCWTYFLSCWWL